jgi:hypothetical protein
VTTDSLVFTTSIMFSILASLVLDSGTGSFRRNCSLIGEVGIAPIYLIGFGWRLNAL